MLGSGTIEIVIEIGMERYFQAYLRRYPHKRVGDAIRATKNYVEGYFRGFGVDPYTPLIARRISSKLSELRSKYFEWVAQSHQGRYRS